MIFKKSKGEDQGEQHVLSWQLSPSDSSPVLTPPSLPLPFSVYSPTPFPFPSTLWASLPLPAPTILCFLASPNHPPFPPLLPHWYPPPRASSYLSKPSVSPSFSHPCASPSSFSFNFLPLFSLSPSDLFLLFFLLFLSSTFTYTQAVAIISNVTETEENTKRQYGKCKVHSDPSVNGRMGGLQRKSRRQETKELNKQQSGKAYKLRQDQQSKLERCTTQKHGHGFDHR